MQVMRRVLKGMTLINSGRLFNEIFDEVACIIWLALPNGLKTFGTSAWNEVSSTLRNNSYATYAPRPTNPLVRSLYVALVPTALTDIVT